MNFVQRLRFLLGSNFKIVSSAVPSWRENRVVEPETNFVKLVKNGWRRNELIYACVSKKCNTASQAALRVYSKRGDKKLEDHRLRQLIQSPNPRMSEFDLWYSVLLFHDFAGVAYYEKVRSRAGQTVQLWPMRPDWVKPMETSGGMLQSYQYSPPGIEPLPMPAEDVLCFPLFDPLNQYQGYPPVAVAAGSGDLDNHVTDYLRLLFQEGGVPPGILKTSKNITEAIAERARAVWKQFYGGYQKWTEPAVLGNDMEYQQTGLGVKEMGIELLDRRAEVRICMALNVPPTAVHTMIGLERSTMANAQEFQQNWWHNDLIPLYKNLNDTLSNQLAPEFGEDIYTAWDFSDVPALRAETEGIKQNALEAFRSGAITRNEYNELAGLESLGPRGDVYLVSASMVEVPAGALVYKPPKLEEESVEEEGQEEEEPETDEEEANTTEEEEETEKSLSLNPRSTKANAPPDDEQRLEMERRITASMTEFFQGQLSRIGAEVEKTYGDRRNGKEHTHHHQPEASA